MDNTEILFVDYKETKSYLDNLAKEEIRLKEKIKQMPPWEYAEAKEDRKRLVAIEETLSVADYLIQTAIISDMKSSYEYKKYDVTLEEIANFLGISVAIVQRNILPQLDYIKPPLGAGKYFVLDALHLSYVEKRMLKWKKIFINRDSLIEYLNTSMVMLCPSNKLDFNADGTYTTEFAYATTTVDFNILDFKLYRDSALKSALVKFKIKDLKRKTEQDLKRDYKFIAEIDGARFTKELQIIDNFDYARHVQVQDGECRAYKNAHKHSIIKFMHTMSPDKKAIPYYMIDSFRTKYSDGDL